MYVYIMIWIFERKIPELASHFMSLLGLVVIEAVLEPKSDNALSPKTAKSAFSPLDML